ncbi:MAG TPA: hypothetical protein VFS44_09700 [Gemmatimonadaceae bacterium]|nr:hypothetical protein [Gemmatimonadaceae bacterium]
MPPHSNKGDSMRWTVSVVGGMCAALAACADGGKIPTSAEAPPRLVASGSVTITSPKAGAVTFAAETRGGGAREPARALALSRLPDGEAHTPVLPIVAVSDGPSAGALLARRGEYRRVLTMHDEQGTTHHLVALYDGSGGPPRAVQHYVGNELVRVMAFRWERVRGGWAQRRILVREVRHGALVLETEARATALQVGMASAGAGAGAGATPFALVRAGVLRALAGVFAPADAQAQFYFSECYTKYKEYWKATAALTSAIIAIEVATESGVGGATMEALYFAYTTALAWAVMAEFELYVCVDNARERESSGTTGPTSGSGSGSGSEPPKNVCLEGSYAANCQTQFGL